MPRHPSSTGRAGRPGALCFTLVLATLSLTAAAPAVAESSESRSPASGPETMADPAHRDWIWPADRFRVANAYVAPAHAYGPGHRGIDIDLLGGAVVRSPAHGVVAFAGAVAGRGILTIDHGGGLVTTLEPVETTLAPGTAIVSGEDLATLALGGHAAPGSLHFGVRLHGEYINPMLLLGGVPRAVLLPCCD